MGDLASLAFPEVSGIDLHPINDYLVIERPKAPNISEGGVHLSLMSQKKQTVGIVLAAGKKAYDAKVGDKVMFRQYDVIKVKRDGRELVFIQNKDLVAVLEG